VRTGKSETLVSVNVFSLIKTEPKSPYALYETSTVSSGVKNVFPLIVTRTTFYELTSVIVFSDFEREKDALIKTGFDELRLTLPEGSKALDNWFTVKTLDNLIYIDLYYEAEELIS